MIKCDMFGQHEIGVGVRNELDDVCCDSCGMSHFKNFANWDNNAHHRPRGCEECDDFLIYNNNTAYCHITLKFIKFLRFLKDEDTHIPIPDWCPFYPSSLDGGE